MRWITIHRQGVVVAGVGVTITIATTAVVATVVDGRPGAGVVTVAISAETDGCRCLRQKQHAGGL